MSKKVINIEDKLPIAGVEDGIIVSQKLDLTVGFKVSLPEIFTLSTSNYNDINESWVQAIKHLPNGAVVTKQDWFITDSYDATVGEDEEMNLLESSSRLHFHERPFLNHVCYLFITLPASPKQTKLLENSLFRSRLIDTDLLNGVRPKRIRSMADQFRDILDRCEYMSVEPLSGTDLCGTKERSGLLEQYLTLSGNGNQEVLCDIDFTDGMQIGDKHCRMFTLADIDYVPPLIGTRTRYEPFSTDQNRYSIGFAAELGLLLDCNHIFTQVIKITEKDRLLADLETKKKHMDSLAKYSRINKVNSEFVENFINQTVVGMLTPVQAHFNVLCWGDAYQIEDIEKRVGTSIKSMGGTPKKESHSFPTIYWGGMPGNITELPREEMFTAHVENMTCLFNVETNYRSSVSPIGIRLVDRLSGRPVNVDISDLPRKMGITTNRNKFILGPTGSGKSFFTNHMLRHYYEQGTDIVIVDVGDSYERLCQLYGGYYFTYTEENPISFNPFFVKDGKLTVEKAESLKSLINLLWKKANEDQSMSEYIGISNSIAGYYQQYLPQNPDVFPCFNTYYEYLQGPYTEQLREEETREKEIDLTNLLFTLRPYYKGGEFDYLLNAENQLDIIDNRLIVFEIDKIKDHPILYPIVTLIIMEIFITKMRTKKGVRKMILIEEAWKAIAREGMAEFIKYLFKTVRKFFGEAIIVTQELKDIINSPIVKDTIIDNSDIKILLDQSKY